MRFPGDIDDEERQRAFESLRAASIKRWGEERTEALDGPLRDASSAAARLDRLSFSRDESPGFYLHDTVPGESE